MIHPVAMVSTDASGGGGSVSVSFNPADGSGTIFSDYPLTVRITVTGANRLKYRIDNGSWTTIEQAIFTPPEGVNRGHSLTASALDSSGNVLETLGPQTYQAGG